MSSLPFKVSWCSPSNIAFIKYWGKKGPQLPSNPSLSMSLKECHTKTTILFSEASALKVDLKLDGCREDKFTFKIKNYLESLVGEYPFLNHLQVDIETHNTFPHGTGIASSASGLSALALGLTDFIFSFQDRRGDQDFFQLASSLARRASGSACRSVYGGFVTWGEWGNGVGSDLFADPIDVHSSLKNLRDSIIVVDSKEKSVSSTSGHGQMTQHFFSEARFNQAKFHFNQIVPAMKTGDFEVVGRILESEALSLHAMMLTSPSPYTLLKPSTLKAIEMIRQFRHDSQIGLYFTLDAGPNLHLIYPESEASKVLTFIQHELTPLAEKIIHDEIGEGPFRC